MQCLFSTRPDIDALGTDKAKHFPPSSDRSAGRSYMFKAISRFIRHHRFVLVFRYSVGLALIFIILFSSHLTPWNQAFDSIKLGAKKIVRDTSYHRTTLNEKRVILDSLLTILQDYYVDEKKIESLTLLKTTLTKLKDDININVTQPDFSHFRLTYEDESIDLTSVHPYGPSDLLRDAISISEFLDELITKGKINSAGNSLDELNDGAFIFANAMLAGLDEHSALLDSYSYDELKQSTEGTFGGLGIIVGVRNNLLTVLKPIPNSPAAKAGLKKGDHILRINNISTYGVPLGDLVNSMRGDPGSIAELVILRKDRLSAQILELKREIIKLESVTHSLIAAGKYKFLHVSIDSFSATTSEELSTLFIKYLKEKNERIHGIILDLRSNPGGLLDQATKVADLFLKQGTIVSTIGRYKEVESAVDGDFKVYLPIVVIINSDSASASEIVAGALQDNNRAIVVGQPSFGKGSVQTIFEYPRNQAIKLTIAKYYTPSGRSIQSTGITPDIWLQPILKNGDNVNIFGDYRYHQLDSTTILPEITRTPSMPAGSFTIKSNYLLSTEESSDADALRDIDFETKFSTFMLKSLLDHYGTIVPDGMQRASHWLAISAHSARSYLKASNAEALEYLQGKLMVDWAGAADPATPTQGLDFSFSDIPKIAKEGQTFTLDWEIVNHSRYDFPQISLFMGPNVLGYEYIEKAIGKIRSFEHKRGSFMLPGLNRPHLGKVSIKGGLAEGHVPLSNTIHKTSITVKPQERPKLVSTVVACDKRSKKPLNTIKPMDEIELEVTVFNEGDVSSSQTEIDVENLSGEQIAVPNAIFQGGILMPRTRVRHYFPVKASNALFSKELVLGVKINSADLVQPIFKEVSINAIPNGSTGIQKMLLSH